MDATQSLAQEVQEVRCLRVSGITGRYIHLNGTYHEEPEHSDGVPCYRKYVYSGATDDTITRRGGYWFFDKNHCENHRMSIDHSEDGVNNDGCCVGYDKPTETDWHITLNGIGYGQIVVKVEEVSAPYQGCAPDPIHSSLCTIMWFRDVENEERADPVCAAERQDHRADRQKVGVRHAHAQDRHQTGQPLHHALPGRRLGLAAQLRAPRLHQGVDGEGDCSAACLRSAVAW